MGPLYKSSRRVNGASKFEDGKAATLPHWERLGRHPWSRSYRPRIRGGQRDIKNAVWTRRLLQAYLDQLEQAPLIRSNDIHAVEKFVDLVRITVVKLQAERRDGELEDGTLHSLLMKKLPDAS